MVLVVHIRVRVLIGERGDVRYSKSKVGMRSLSEMTDRAKRNFRISLLYNVIASNDAVGTGITH